MAGMEQFEPRILLAACRNCLGPNNRIFTDHYLCIFSEVLKLFTEWGLGAALKDAAKSVKRLEIRRVAGAGCFYRELQLLIQHETELRQREGTNAFITLHERLTFAVTFVNDLNSAVVKGSKFSTKKRLQTYTTTLAEHQSALTRSAVRFALLKISGRRELLAALQKHCHGEMSAVEALQDIANSLQRVHDTVDTICCKNSL